MEIQIFAVFLTSFVLTISSHPKHSDVIPKEYYKRQILQPIPGYIPVYIKADGEPVVRSESQKQSSSVTPQKVTQPREKNLSKQSDKEVFSKNEGKKLDKTSAEKILKEAKNLSIKLQEEDEPKSTKSTNQKETSQIKADGRRFNKKL